MADDGEKAKSEPQAPRPCMPCSGSGKVTSNAGGEPHQVDCPWCEGTGMMIPDHDAQAAQRGESAPDA